MKEKKPVVWWEEIARNTTERSSRSQHATLLEWMLCRGCRETSREALNRKNVSAVSHVQRVWQCDLFFYFPCCNEAWTYLGKYLQGSEAKQVDGLYELLNVKNHQKCISCLLSITSKILVKIVRHAKVFSTDHSFTPPPATNSIFESSAAALTSLILLSKHVWIWQVSGQKLVTM